MICRQHYDQKIYHGSLDTSCHRIMKGGQLKGIVELPWCPYVIGYEKRGRYLIKNIDTMMKNVAVTVAVTPYV